MILVEEFICNNFGADGIGAGTKRGRGNRRNSCVIVSIAPQYSLTTIAQLLQNSCASKPWKLEKVLGNQLYGNYCVAFCELLRCLLWIVLFLAATPFTPTPRALLQPCKLFLLGSVSLWGFSSFDKGFLWSMRHMSAIYLYISLWI